MRGQISEAELVDIQRKARSVFQRVDNVADWVFNHQSPHQFSEQHANMIDLAAKLAREVSDEVDRLTDFVRATGGTR